MLFFPANSHPMHQRKRYRWRKSAGRITAGPVFARYSVPEIHLSAMDGIAVVSADTRDASDRRPVTLARAARVNTGNVVPPEFDAVIMIEDVWETDGRYTIRKPPSHPGSTSARPGRTLPSPRW